MAARPSAASADSPAIRRYRWPWRGASILFGWLVLLLSVRLLWGAYSQFRLDRVIAAARSDGRLMEAAALDATLADHDNRAFWLMRAIQRMKAAAPNAPQGGPGSPGEDASAIARRAWLGLPLTEENRLLLARLAPLLRDVRAARACWDCAWPVRYAVPMNWWNITYPAELRQLARVVAAAALIASVEGQHAQAMELLHDCLAISASLNDPRLFSGGLAVGEYVDLTVTSTIGRVVGALRGAELAAQREAIESLLRELADASPAEQAWRDAALRETMALRDQTLLASDVSLLVAVQAGRPLAWLTAPGVRLDVPRQQRALERELDRGLDPAALLASGEGRLTLSAPARLTRFASGADTYLNGIRISVMRRLARRAMVACVLAIRLYEYDNGTLPATLSELVPFYLPAPPLDPQNALGELFRYCTDDDPRVYSLGRNGFDDGGLDNDDGRRGGTLDDVARVYGPRRVDARFVLPAAPLALSDAPSGLAGLFPPAALTPADARRASVEAQRDDTQEVDAEREE